MLQRLLVKLLKGMYSLNAFFLSHQRTFAGFYLIDFIYYLLLLLLSHFSRVRLCVTRETAAQQAAPSLGFSRQEHWSGLPFPSPMHESGT